MLAEKIYTEKEIVSISSKLADYIQFAKLRLSSLVVFSAAIGFAIASENIDWQRLFWLVIGGFLVTASSNGFNQIIERNLDKLMTRTENRPLPQGRMSLQEAFFLASSMGISGIAILGVLMNPLSGILAAAALMLYVLVYTPLKPISPFAVFAGAFPGAIPPMLGCVAATEGFGHITMSAWILFIIQFIWQFPHFWAIAWVMDEDYKKAGFRMLPSPAGKGKSSSFQILIYTLFLLPISLSPVVFKMSGTLSAIIISVSGLFFIYQAYRLYKNGTVKAAQHLMFGSFIYLPLVQLTIMTGM